jgi:hypothetical protein
VKEVGVINLKKHINLSQRKKIKDVERVYEANPGIGIGKGSGKYKLSDFGGISYKNWKEGVPFIKAENRNFTCPAWWYQSANYKLKPKWSECLLIGSFSKCVNFKNKAKCWERWDEEFGGK